MDFNNLAMIMIAVLQIVILILVRRNQVNNEESELMIYEELSYIKTKSREYQKRIANLERVPKRGRPRKKKDGNK